MHAPHPRRILLAAAWLAVALPGCATPEPQPAAAPAQPLPAAQATARAMPPPAGLTQVPGIRQPKPELYVAGQPTDAQWRAFAAAGVTTVINLRPVAEMKGRDERAEVEAAGMRYLQIPVAGMGGITTGNAEALAQALQQAGGAVLVHCASGNRVGALLALDAARAGMPVEAAIAYGRSAGLAGAEAAVRERIAEQAAAN